MKLSAAVISKIYGDDRTIYSAHEIKEILNFKRIPWKSQWGTGQFDDLVKTQTNDQVTLITETPRLTIVVKSAVITVQAYVSGQWLQLWEKEQIFHNGEVHVCNFAEIAKTYHRGETTEFAGQRCLREKLGITRLYEISDCGVIETLAPRPSKKWLGMEAIYRQHHQTAILSRRAFKKNGYIVKKKDRTIHFEWRKAIISGMC
ncbi:MAG: hypothetical protein M3Q80_01255 [bacterium]|nr:hypothetical protein [bacterium]